jgi:hypothetical protein
VDHLVLGLDRSREDAIIFSDKLPMNTMIRINIGSFKMNEINIANKFILVSLIELNFFFSPGWMY